MLLCCMIMGSTNSLWWSESRRGLLHLSSGPSWLRQWSSKGRLLALFHPFTININPAGLTRNINLVRVLFGIGLLHHYIDIIGFAGLANDPKRLIDEATIGVLLSLFITVGFLTPFTLLWLILDFLVFPPIVSYLGTQIMIIVAWGLLFFGAGKTYSLDAYLVRLPGVRWVISWSYSLALDLTAINIAKIRFLMISLFWGIAFGAMIYHFYDPLWLRGDVLQLVLTTPYLTDFYQLFSDFRDATPLFYDLTFTVGLLIQGIWELFLLPLMYYKWGRIFVAIQGLLFFLFSFFFLNLGYLPYFELCWWLLLFNHTLTLTPFKNVVKSYVVEEEISPKIPMLFNSFLGMACAITLLHLIVNSSGILFDQSWRQSWPWNSRTWLATHRLFAQGPVNVFNQPDLGMGAVHFILAETDDTGQLLRVVPFLDINGGRLDYLRNDYLYFNHSLRWQRSLLEEKFENADVSKISTRTRDLMQRVIELDICLTGLNAPRFYEADVFVKQMVSQPYFLIWSPVSNTTQEVFSFSPEDIAQLKEKCFMAFDLPPGHFLSESRLVKTQTYLQSIPTTDTIDNLYTLPPDLFISPNFFDQPVEPITLEDIALIDRSINFDGTNRLTVRYQNNKSSPLIQLHERSYQLNSYFVARGTLHQGDFILGLQQNKNWLNKIRVTTPGDFNIIIRIPDDSLYALTLADDSVIVSPQTHITINQSGWVQISDY